MGRLAEKNDFKANAIVDSSFCSRPSASGNGREEDVELRMEQRSVQRSGEQTEDNQASDVRPGMFRTLEAEGLAKATVVTKSAEELIFDAHFHMSMIR